MCFYLINYRKQFIPNRVYNKYYDIFSGYVPASLINTYVLLLFPTEIGFTNTFLVALIHLLLNENDQIIKRKFICNSEQERLFADTQIMNASFSRNTC